MKKLIVIFLLLFSINNSIAADLIIWAENAESITIDRYSLQQIFTRKISRWPNGQNITVFIKPKNSIEHRDFVKNILGISNFYYEQLLEQQTFAGKSSSVTEVATDKHMITKIETTPGAIGYINYEIYAGNKKVIIIDRSSIS